MISLKPTVSVRLYEVHCSLLKSRHSTAGDWQTAQGADDSLCLAAEQPACLANPRSGISDIHIQLEQWLFLLRHGPFPWALSHFQGGSAISLTLCTVLSLPSASLRNKPHMITAFLTKLHTHTTQFSYNFLDTVILHRRHLSLIFITAEVNKSHS